ncbi:hypothetical protein H6G00_13700 [Leptolyngbya sp. FACHB-541]|uniref:WD40 domain-containing protein n=1 Tax=Leptolyngbya sp. FACHB-541 TaxID=2692810 RepID=UPI00168675B5|nr:NB-ARC domain-containing protein [Leptolyngbya sp. FACHB-541]MBD1997669.1 hypothetical protein [Leptolyngbya sp. FACHB-541]
MNEPRPKRGVVLSTQGWQKLQDALHQMNEENSKKSQTLEQLSELTGLDPGTVAKVLSREVGVDRRTLDRFFQAFNLTLNKSDYSKPISSTEKETATFNEDWGEAIDTSLFYGRATELATLQNWILNEQCRLVAVLGAGGIGKTALSTKLARQVQNQFERVIWRSLRYAPLFQDLLQELVRFLSPQAETDVNLSSLIKYLQQYRCLVILDNLESVLQEGNWAGRYKAGYEDYGELLKLVGEVPHQSCLLLTSREKPKEAALLAGESSPVQTLHLIGLMELEIQEIFNTKGRFLGSKSDWIALTEHYAGNPLVLKIVATHVQDIFNSSISSFLQEGTTLPADIEDLLKQQFERLKDAEKEVMYWLAINREPVSASALREDLLSLSSREALPKTLQSLMWRSLIEKVAPTSIKNIASASGDSLSLFTLHPVVMEYVTQQLIKQTCQEIETQTISLLKSHLLVKAQAKDYVKQMQLRFIVEFVINHLLMHFGSKNEVVNRIKQLLARQRSKTSVEVGYVAGNLFNLLRQLEIDLSNYDFSNLTIRQADLSHINLHNTNFANTELIQPAFTEMFGSILTIAFSPDSKLLATGDVDGKIRLWQIEDSKQLFVLEELGWVRSVAFSPDGRLLGSGSSDRVIKLWDVSTGQCYQTLKGHTHLIHAITFHPSRPILASASEDQTVRIWDISSGQCLQTLQGHSDAVNTVMFSQDSQFLATGSYDQTVRLWDTRTWKCVRTLRGHGDRIRSLVFSPDSQAVMSSSDDLTIRIWDSLTGNCLNILQGHTRWIRSIACSPDGQLLASGSDDQTIRIWDLPSGQCCNLLQAHSSRVWSVAFGQDGRTLASSSDDETIKFWGINTGRCYKTIKGYSNRVLSIASSAFGQVLAGGYGDRTVKLWNINTDQYRELRGHLHPVRAVAFSPDGQILASGSEDKTIKLWDIKSDRCLHTWKGHTDWVWSICFSPNGQRLASSGDDRTIRVWDTRNGHCLHTLQGHTSWVWAVTFSLDGQTLISGSGDQTLRIWDVSTGDCLSVLQGHNSGVWAIALSPNGQVLASGSVDGNIRLWDISTGHCFRDWQGHTAPVSSICFNATGQVLASGSVDRTVKLWDVSTGDYLKTLQGHTHRVRSIDFVSLPHAGGVAPQTTTSSSNEILASSSEDETIKLWNLESDQCFKSLRAIRPYEQMLITNIKGLTEAQRTTLKSLGAIVRNG